MGLFRKLVHFEYAEPSNEKWPPVSVIICAKNEYQNLQEHLPFILSQDYEHYEVIVVNDHSDDDSQEVLEQLLAQYAHLRVIHLDDAVSDLPGKKYALAKGIEAATHEVVLLTDADCRPASNQWIKQMILPFQTENAEVCLGYGPYIQQDGWLNRWIRFETVLTAIQYLSFALVEQPYMGVGRNLAYRKQRFDLEKLHKEISSGDDDLLVQSLRNHKVSIQINPESFTYSSAPTLWRDYYHIKSRHMGTSFHYAFWFKLLLSLFAGSHLGFWILFFLLVIKFPVLAFVFLMIKWITQLLLFPPIAQKLHERDLVNHFWWLDLGLAVYYAVMIPGLFLRDKKTW